MKIIDKLQWNYEVKISLLQKVFSILLGFFLLFAGISHLTFNRLEFVAQVPNWVPLSVDLVVVLSGIVEISLGLFLIGLRKLKPLVGVATAVFFVMIFPGNISQYVNKVDAFGLDTDRARFARLFFQPLLVAWALWSTGGFKVLQNFKKSKS